MLSVTDKPFMLIVVMLNVVMLSVMAPDKDIHVCHCLPLTPYSNIKGKVRSLPFEWSLYSQIPN